MHFAPGALMYLKKNSYIGFCSAGLFERSEKLIRWSLHQGPPSMYLAKNRSQIGPEFNSLNSPVEFGEFRPAVRRLRRSLPRRQLKQARTFLNRVTGTVAILAQGTSWAVAVTQAFWPRFESHGMLNVPRCDCNKF